MRSTSGTLGAGFLLTFLLAGTSLDAAALGFGRTVNNTRLGQPLDFSVLIRFDGGEFIASECVVAEVVAGDDRVPPANVKVTIDPPNAAGERLLRVHTTAPMVEPVVSVNMNLGCPPQLSRNFVAFIDPPTLNLAEAPAVADTTPPAARAAAEPPAPPPHRLARPSAPAPTRSAEAASDVPATPRRPRPARTAVRSSTRDVALAASAPSDAAASAPRSNDTRETRARAAAAVANRGPRLQLEAPPARSAAAASAVAPLAVAQPASGAAEATAAQAAAALAVAAQASQAEARASEAQAQLRALQDSVAKLRAENDATRNTLTSLQSRLHDSEAGRSGENPLNTWLLAVIALLMLALAGMLLWMRRRERQREAWWASRQRGGSDVAGASMIIDSHLPDDFDASAESVLSAASESVLVEPSVAPSESPGPVTWKPTHTIPELGLADAAPRTLTADQLIDLEQQVEFFIALGQDEAAAGLLSEHITASGGVTPLPYLQLLDMYRRGGNREGFTRVREDFNRQFIATAPSWDDAGVVARSLEDFPAAIEQLSEAWPMPPRAMGVLELMLFRSSGDEPVFDLAAARELLFLYEIARDLAGHVDDHVMVVDFELPLGGAMPADVAVTQSLRPLQASRPASVDLDLDLDDVAVAEPAQARADELSYGSAYGQAEPVGVTRKGR